LNLFLKFFSGEGVRITEKFPGLLGALFVYKKEYGGLGVRRLKKFNIASLAKWCWRMLVDRGGFWYRVLVARYGEEVGRLEVGAGVFLLGGGR
jgi:hypothetical protein